MHPVIHHIVTELQPVGPTSQHTHHHSTETSIFHTVDSILLSSDSGKSLIIFGNFLAECYLKSETGWFIFLSYFKSHNKECQAEHEILLEKNEVCRKYKDSDHPHNAGLFPCLISCHN